MLAKQVFSTHRQRIIESQRKGEISKIFVQREREWEEVASMKFNSVIKS